MYKVCVLMSTYNGEKYLEEMLGSVVSQTGVEVHLLVRDDGSTDSTVEILDRWQSEGKLKWYTGENLRSAKSFMHLLKHAPNADFYAFCDQDDVWLPEKLSKAVQCIEKEMAPALYISKTTLVDKDLNYLADGYFSYTCCLREAIVTNAATGCTMVINKYLRELALRHEPCSLTMHDAWIYKLCLSFNGYVYADSNSYILYRQHSYNVVGASESLLKKLKRRFSLILSKGTGERSKEAKELFRLYGEEMPLESKRLLKMVSEYDESFISRLRLLFCGGLTAKRKSVLFKMYLSILIGKF